MRTTRNVNALHTFVDRSWFMANKCERMREKTWRKERGAGWATMAEVK